MQSCSKVAALRQLIWSYLFFLTRNFLCPFARFARSKRYAFPRLHFMLHPSLPVASLRFCSGFHAFTLDGYGCYFMLVPRIPQPVYCVRSRVAHSVIRLSAASASLWLYFGITSVTRSVLPPPLRYGFCITGAPLIHAAYALRCRSVLYAI